MANFEITMPKMGESVIEATITKWLKQEGDQVEEDDSICELATDKVDSEIPSPVEGKLSKILIGEGETVEVGRVIAVIEVEGEEPQETEGEDETADPGSSAREQASSEARPKASADNREEVQKSSGKETAPGAEQEEAVQEKGPSAYSESERFYSPLVKNIAKKENISLQELENIKGSGQGGRVTKEDILAYLDKRHKGKLSTSAPASQAKGQAQPGASVPEAPASKTPKPAAGDADEIVEMDRMRKLIADHMVSSRQISPHVTSYHEVDMTRVVKWRNQHKEYFREKEGAKLTFTPILIEAAVKALKDFPGVNGSVDGYTMIYRKKINIGMATALPNGNLIVPVINDADRKNLLGLTKEVNDLAGRARANKLKPDEIQGGTFTVTNLGSFGNITGSPIINQPQVAILALGAIKKRPVVIETELGDTIAIRHMMVLSLSYDHRMVDGAMGGLYLAKMAEYLENFNPDRSL
ncbi:MAG: dihydrolipoamide acetyltransferase family protein [Bacteroidales bacterium]